MEDVSGMKNKVLGVIGIVWGGGIVLNWILSAANSGSAAYEVGRIVAVVIGAILFFAGIQSFRKKPAESVDSE